MGLIQTDKDIFISNEFNELNSEISKIGFDGVLFSFIPKPQYLDKDIQPLLHYSKSFSPYIKHYLKNDYGNKDFVLRLAIQGREHPIDWWEEINNGIVSTEEQEVTLDAKKLFNIHHGLSIPVLHGTFAISGISVICMNDDIDNFNRLKHLHLPKLKSLAQKYHSHCIKLNHKTQFFINPLLARFTVREKIVLKHLISGQPMKTIPQVDGLNQQLAEKTLLQIRKEFGNISSKELMYMLGMMNMYEHLFTPC